MFDELFIDKCTFHSVISSSYNSHHNDNITYLINRDEITVTLTIACDDYKTEGNGQIFQNLIDKLRLSYKLFINNDVIQKSIENILCVKTIHTGEAIFTFTTKLHILNDQYLNQILSFKLYLTYTNDDLYEGYNDTNILSLSNTNKRVLRNFITKSLTQHTDIIASTGKEMTNNLIIITPALSMHTSYHNVPSPSPSKGEPLTSSRQFCLTIAVENKYYSSPVTIHNIIIHIDKSIKLGESDLMMLKEYASVDNNDALVHYSDDIHTKLKPGGTDNDDVDKSMYIHTLLHQLHSSPSTNLHPLISDKRVVRLITPPPHTSTTILPSTVSSSSASTSNSSDSTAAPTLSSNVYTINTQEAYSFTYLISGTATTTTTTTCTASTDTKKERDVVVYSTPITVFYHPYPHTSSNDDANSLITHSVCDAGYSVHTSKSSKKIDSMTVYALWSE